MNKKEAERQAFFDMYQEEKQTPLDYWEEKKKEYQRAIDFLENAKPGETYRIERYAIPESHPYSMNKFANVHDKKTVKIYAIDKQGLWFTTYDGTAIYADTLIKWERLPEQKELFD
jgi:hypothetical protein